jgi:hypothetical protein
MIYTLSRWPDLAKRRCKSVSLASGVPKRNIVRRLVLTIHLVRSRPQGHFVQKVLVFNRTRDGRRTIAKTMNVLGYERIPLWRRLVEAWRETQ